MKKNNRKLSWVEEEELKSNKGAFIFFIAVFIIFSLLLIYKFIM